MSELIAISVVIGDRSYRIKIQPEEEQVIRAGIKTINDKIIEYKTQFAGKDMQDYVAMVLIWHASEETAGMAEDIEKGNLKERLNSIEKLLDAQLS